VKHSFDQVVTFERDQEVCYAQFLYTISDPMVSLCVHLFGNLKLKLWFSKNIISTNTNNVLDVSELCHICNPKRIPHSLRAFYNVIVIIIKRQ